VLGNRDNDRLMVGGSVDGREAVDTSGKTIGNLGSEDTVLSSGVETLEEGEATGISGVGRVNRVNELSNDVRVTDDLASSVQLLGSSKVALLGVDEVTGLHVADSHLDGKRGVGGDGTKVLWEHELGGWHVLGAGDDTDRGRVARALRDLLAIGDGKVGNS
jgi:hypothetical protein